jgi:hypothetical protein
MASEFDHLFILSDIGAAAAERLISFGLVEGTSNTHPGQGTANRRFFFSNAMLELLWVHDPAEATSPAIAPTGLWERWQTRRDGCCPFGIGLRPGGDSGDQAPFPSWAYQPPYLPDGMSIAVGANSDRVTEPWLFQIPFGQRPDRYPAQRSQPLEHRFGLRQITRVELIGPWQSPLSAELQALVTIPPVRLRHGPAYAVELGLDDESRGRQADFRPGLPLLLSW